eukprot:220034_1
MSAENEHLHSENAALYEQIQQTQINTFIQNTKLQSNETDENAPHTFNGITVNLQSLIKRGKLLTEQCADLNIENKTLRTDNHTLSQQISKLQKDISNTEAKIDSNAPKESQVLALVSADPHYHEAVSRELRHRNQQLMDQVRCLQHDLETDTELIDRLQKENGELRIKLKTCLQRYQNEDPQMIIAVDAKGEPWQDIINGLRKQLQEARREIAQLCEESMGKTQHINEVESVNTQLVKNVGTLEKENKELSASLAATPNTEPTDQNTDAQDHKGPLADQCAKTERLCEQMEGILTRKTMNEEKTKDELKKKLKELRDDLAQTKTLFFDIEQRKDELSTQNEVISHDLDLLKRAKGQLSDHNEQLATEITNLQSIQFEQQQKISSQQQEVSELRTLYENVQSQLGINESLNQQLQSERHQIVRLFAVSEEAEVVVPMNKMIDLGGFDNEESKMESMEPSLLFNQNPKGNNKEVELEHAAKELSTLDIRHEIECLLNSYHKMTEKNTELKHVIDRNEKELSIQNDFNAKFEEIKRLLIEAARARGLNKEDAFDVSALSMMNKNNGSANIGLNTSMQYMEDIMKTHKLMKEEEFEQLVEAKKELMDELESVQSKYDSLSRENANQSQKLSLMEQESKHVANQLSNVEKERDALRSELQNNAQLTDKVSRDFRAIGHERDHLYQKIKSLEAEVESKEFLSGKEEEYHRLKQQMNELNDLNMKQSNQMELLQSNVKEAAHRYTCVTSDFKSMKSKYERLNEEYDNLSSQQQKLYYEMNEMRQLCQQKATQIISLENRLSSATDECHKYEQQISKNKLKYEQQITDYQSKITSLQLALDSAKFEMVTAQSSESNKHIEDLNEQLELLRNKYESKSAQTKTHYSDKVAKMNEAVTKLSAARTKLQKQLMDKEEKHTAEMNRLQSELQIADTKNSELDDKKALLLEDCNRRIESALKHKSTVDRELQQLQELHENKGEQLQDLLAKYQQSVQENEIIGVAKEQHQMLVKEIDHLHAQLKQSRDEHQQLRQKAQLHYTRRKEEWKKLKQLEAVVNAMKKNESEVSALCDSIEDVLGNKHKHKKDNKAALDSILISLKSLESSRTLKIEYEELAEKCKIIEEQNGNLRSQMIQLNHDIQSLEDENNTLRDERRRSLEGNTNEHLSEKINLQRQIRIIREERDAAEKKLKQNETKSNQLTLKLHQLQLQCESAQERVDRLETSESKLKQELDANNEVISTLEADKMALSNKSNELYDANVSCEEKNRKSQQEIGKFQVKSDRLRQQRDYAKLKYKELKAKFNSLEKQFRSLQSRFNQNNTNQQTTSQTMPF